MAPLSYTSINGRGTHWPCKRGGAQDGLDFQDRTWSPPRGQLDLTLAVGLHLGQFQGQFGGIVLFAEVGQGQEFESAGAIPGQLGRLGVGEMASASGNPLFEPGGVIYPIYNL